MEPNTRRHRSRGQMELLLLVIVFELPWGLYNIQFSLVKKRVCFMMWWWSFNDYHFFIEMLHRQMEGLGSHLFSSVHDEWNVEHSVRYFTMTASENLTGSVSEISDHLLQAWCFRWRHTLALNCTHELFTMKTDKRSLYDVLSEQWVLRDMTLILFIKVIARLFSTHQMFLTSCHYKEHSVGENQRLSSHHAERLNTCCSHFCRSVCLTLPEFCVT